MDKTKIEYFKEYISQLPPGNITYKTMVHTADAVNGNLLTGTKAPVILTSRSDTFEVKVNSLALGAVVAEYMKNN